MATNFPASLDTLTNPSATDTLDSPPHDEQHADANDAIEALQAKVGVDGSAVTTSIDYQLNTGYRYHSTVYFTSSGSFTKASYPWLRAMRVKVQGAGGGGGGTDYAGGTPIRAAGASGGHGGTFAESFITDIASLVASVTVTVGSGGSGGAGGTFGSTAGSDGSAGTDSSFGNGAAYEVSGVGGRQGLRGSDTNVKYGTASLDYLGSPGVGDIVIPGSAGGVGISGAGGDGETYATGFGGVGGHSVLGHSNRQSMARTSSNTAQDGLSGNGYGSGGSGGAVAGTAQDGATGGDGANGIVILELFA